jgi:hypothetical protein
VTVSVSAIVPPGRVPGSEVPVVCVFTASVPAETGAVNWKLPWAFAHADEGVALLPLARAPTGYDLILEAHVVPAASVDVVAANGVGADAADPGIAAVLCSARARGWTLTLRSATTHDDPDVEFTTAGLRAGTPITVTADRSGLFPPTARARLDFFDAIDERRAAACAAKLNAGGPGCAQPTFSVELVTTTTTTTPVAADIDDDDGGGGGGGGGDDVISQIVFDGELPADALNVDLSAVLVLSAIDPVVRALPRHGIVWRTISIVASLPRDGALRETIGPQTIDGAGILNRFYRLEFERAPESPPTLNVGVLLGLEARRPGSHLCVLTDETPPGGFLSATQDCREASSTEAIEVGFVTISEAVSCCADERFLWIGQYRYRSVRAGPILVPMAGDDAQSRAIYAVVTPVDPAENPGSSAGSSGGGAQDSNSAEDASNTTKFIIGVVVTRDTLSQVLLVNAVVWCVMLLCIALIKARHRVMSVLRQSCGCFRCFRAEGLSSSSGSTNARPLLSPEAAAELDMIAMREIMNTPVTSTAAAATGISQGEHRGDGAVPSSCGADPDNDNDGDTVVIGGGRGGGDAINQHAGTGRSGNVNLNSSYNNGNGGNDDDDDDDDDNDDNECRFCRDPTAEPLIAPCLCNGSLRFVHRSCLDNWRFRGTGNPLACDICRGTYDIPVPFGVRMQTFLSTWFLGLSHTQQLLVATLVLECAIVTAGYILKFYLAAFYCEHGLYSWAFWSFVHHFLGASVGCAFFLAVYVGFSLTGGRSRAAAARARAAAPQPAPGHFVNLDDVETDNENRDRGVANNPGQVDAEAARLLRAFGVFFFFLYFFY